MSEIIAIDLPGKGRRVLEDACCSFDEAVESCVVSILDIDDYSSNVLFGYSMGGLLAYESTKRIYQDYGKLPKNLIIAACSPPFVCAVEKNLSDYDDEGLCEYLIETGGVSREIIDMQEFKDFFLEIIRDDFKIVDSYNETQEVRSLPIVLDVFYSSDEDRVEDWQRYTSAKCRFEYFEGGHFFIRRNTEDVCRRLNRIVCG